MLPAFYLALSIDFSHHGPHQITLRQCICVKVATTELAQKISLLLWDCSSLLPNAFFCAKNPSKWCSYFTVPVYWSKLESQDKSTDDCGKACMLSQAQCEVGHTTRPSQWIQYLLWTKVGGMIAPALTVSGPMVTIMDIRMTFYRVNPFLPDGVPSRVLRTCMVQQAG